MAKEDHRPESFHLGYRPSLDGFRGVAIILVVLSHLSLVHLDVLHPQFGVIGVDIFFVLSGFLITTLLIAEWDQSNDISLKSFYWRRGLRLLPALIAMLIVSIIYVYLTSPLRIAVKNLVFALVALFYSTNWLMICRLGERSNHLFDHTWSLSVEEQFYFIWPLVLFFLLRMTKSRTSLLWLALLGALLSNLERVVLVVLGETSFWRFYCGTDTRADSLLLGCCAGIVVSSNLLPQRRWVENILKTAAPISLFGLYWLTRRDLNDPWTYCVGWFLASVFAVTIIVQLVTTSKSMLHWAFENRLLVCIGKISYGLYLWHLPVYYMMRNFHGGRWPYAVLPVSAVVALMSYYLIERPCLRLKKRFERVK